MPVNFVIISVEYAPGSHDTLLCLVLDRVLSCLKHYRICLSLSHNRDSAMSDPRRVESWKGRRHDGRHHSSLSDGSPSTWMRECMGVRYSGIRGTRSPLDLSARSVGSSTRTCRLPGASASLVATSTHQRPCAVSPATNGHSVSSAWCMDSGGGKRYPDLILAELLDAPLSLHRFCALT